MGISLTFARLSPSDGQVGYALLTRAPVDAYRKQASNIVSPRLACVKPVASVHPEPGSNSSLYKFVSFSEWKFSVLRTTILQTEEAACATSPDY